MSAFILVAKKGDVEVGVRTWTKDLKSGIDMMKELFTNCKIEVAK